MTAQPELTPAVSLDQQRAVRLRALISRVLNMLPGREGAFWVLFALATPKILGPVFTIGLRRFLGPGVSGTYDLATVPYKFLDNFRNFGTGPALVFERTVSRQVANTAWTLNMIFAVIVTGLAQVFAPLIAAWYGHPEIATVFRILSIAYVFASVASVHSFLLLRDLDFRARSIPPLGQVIAAGDIAVLFAVWGFGAGALIARELVSVIMGAILLWAVYPYRPKLEFVPSIAWKLFRYGFWIGAGLTILYASQNADVFIGGKVISHMHNGVKDMGFYTTSWKLAFISASVFTLMASSMVFPTLSRMRDNLPGLRETLLKSIRQLGLVMFPAAALLAVVAPVLIGPVLGQKWFAYRDSFMVLSLLSIYAGNRTMLSIFFEGYKSIGKPSVVWWYNAVKLLIMAPAMYFAAHQGIIALAIVYIPVQVIEVPVALYLAHRLIGVSPLAVARAASTPLVTTLLMSAAVLVVELSLTRGLHVGDTLTLGACLVTAAAVYIGTIFVFDRRIILEARATLVKGL